MVFRVEGRQATFSGAIDEKFSAAAKVTIEPRFNCSPARKTITAWQRSGVNLGRGLNFECLRRGQMAHLPGGGVAPAGFPPRESQRESNPPPRLPKLPP